MPEQPGGDYLWWAARMGPVPRDGDGGGYQQPRVLALLETVNRTMCDDREPSRAASWRRLQRAVQDALTTR